MAAVVTAVSRSPRHRFCKDNEGEILLVAGLGVEGDAHSGATVQHRSRKRWTPQLPNLRQVHLLHEELFDEVARGGFAVESGQLGENVTTRGLDLLALPVATRLGLGAEAVVELTGLRNPCVQLDRFQDGLMAAVLDRDEEGRLVRKAGVMAVVVTGGVVRPGDDIDVALPAQPHRPLEKV